MAIAKQDTKVSDAAVARKNRIAKRSRKLSAAAVISNSSTDEMSNDLNPAPMEVSSSEAKATPQDILESVRRKKPHITGIKKQSRYDPGVAMTKEELKAWRKEARRVRNRESAAASRKKSKEQIDVLQGQVNEVQSKYEAALQYIIDLEEKLRGSGSSSSAFYPSEVLRQDLMGTRQAVSPVQNDLAKNTSYQQLSTHPSTYSSSPISQKHIIDNTIIRPIACV